MVLLHEQRREPQKADRNEAVHTNQKARALKLRFFFELHMHHML